MSSVRHRITVPYTGNHKKVAVYAVTDGGKRFFRTYDTGFDTETFIRYVMEMKRRFEKISVVLDRAPQHRSKDPRRKFERDGDIRFVYFPRGSPYLTISRGTGDRQSTACWCQNIALRLPT